MVHASGKTVPAVVHISTASSWRGGERQALFLAGSLKEHGFKSVAAVKAESEMHVRCIEHGIPVEPLPFRGELDGYSMLRLASLLRKTGASLVHAHDAHAVTFATVAGLLAGIPSVATRRVDFPLRSPWKYRSLSRLICISQAIREVCAASGLDPEEMPVVNSGIDTEWTAETPNDRESAVAELFPFIPVKHILFNAASLVDHKGQRFLIEAMPAILHSYPETVLVIAGEGELLDSLLELAVKLDVSRRVCFAGFRNDVPRLLVACDVFVMPSHMEGLGTSLMDAMAAGKPVVATKAGGMAELVEDRVTGLQVPAGDPEALASAVVELLGDTELRHSLSKAARERAVKDFSIRRMAEGTADVYRDILAGY